MDNAEIYQSLAEKTNEELISILENHDISMHDDAVFIIAEQILKEREITFTNSQQVIPPSTKVPQQPSPRRLPLVLGIFAAIFIIVISASILRDRIEWRSVEKENTIVAYERFINEYPHSSRVQDANNRIAELNFAKAKEINSVGAYKHFIISNPQSSLTNEAKKQIDVLLNKDRAPALCNAKTAQVIVNYSSPLTNDLGTKILLEKWVELAGLTLSKDAGDIIVQVNLNAKPLGCAYNVGYRYTGGILDGVIEIKAHQNYSIKETFHVRRDPPSFVLMTYKGEYSEPERIFQYNLIKDSGFIPQTTSLMSKAFGTQTLVAMLEQTREIQADRGQPMVFGTEPDVLVREEAAKALVKIGPPAVDPLLNALNNKDNCYRDTIIGCLGQMKVKRAVPAITKIYKETEPNSNYIALNESDVQYYCNLHNAAHEALINITGKNIK